MIDLQTLVVPTDFSELSLEALPVALALARSHGAEVVLAHACASEGEGTRARERLDHLLASLEPLARRAVVGVAGPVDFLVDLAGTSEKTLLVMATHGRRGLARRLARSTAERVVSRAPCPVLTVKEGDSTFLDDPEGPLAPSGLRIRRILVPSDFTTWSLKALRYAGELARAYGSHLVLLHVLESRREAASVARRRHARRFLDQIGSRVPIVSHEVLVEAGPAGRVIAQAARLHQAGLVVMATRGRRTVAGLRRPSVARSVVRRAPCPVLTVKHLENEFILTAQDLVDSAGNA